MGKIPEKQKSGVNAKSRADNWVNSVNGLGSQDRDRTQAARFQSGGTARLTNYWETLFAEDPIAHRIAELPAREMLRQGFRLDLDSGGDQQAEIMGAWDELNASALVIEAMALARALGGAALFIGADDDRPLEDPLDLENLRAIRFLKVLTRNELYPKTFYADMTASKYGEPETYTVTMSPNAGTIAAASAAITIHESRLLVFEGVTTTPSRRRANGGWGESVFVRTENNISLMAQAVAGLANALSDGDQAIFKLDGLLDIMRGGAEGDAAIRTRLSQLQYGRSVARAVAIDASQESFEYVSRSFGGYDTGLYALMFILSSACGIPVTLLFGRAPAGLNATGDTDVRFFYDTIKSEQELRLLKPLRRLLTVIMSSREGPTNGQVPETWSISFRPLMQSSPTEHADIRLKTAQADQIELDMGVITPQEIADSHYGGDEYEQGITLDRSIDRGEVAPMPEPFITPVVA